MPLKEPKTMERWISMEFRKLNANLVSRQISLTELLSMEFPSAKTREGKEYEFNKEALIRFSKLVPSEFHRSLKLPIFIFKDTRVLDSCYFIDPVAVEVLQNISEISSMYKFRDKKLWLSRPLAYEIANKYPTLVQFVVH